MQAGVDWSAMQLFNRIEEVAHVLPPSSRALHHAELQQRHHAIDYSITGTVARVCDSMHSLPQHQWRLMNLSKDRILVCHGGCVKQHGAVCIPHYVPQSEFINQFLSTAPAYTMPCMSSIVYPVSVQGSSVRRDAAYAYLCNGTWVQAAADGCAKLTGANGQLNVFTNTKPQVSVHGKYGLYALFFMHEPEKSFKATLYPEARKGEDVENPQPAVVAVSESAVSEGKVGFHAKTVT
jgi:hypothetical protein